MTDRRLVHVVDDDEAMRESLTFLLETAGFEVLSYDNGATFLDRPDQSELGCVLTDVRMPGIDGLELVRRLRAAESSLPVVVMTGHGDISLAVEAMKLGATDFLEKPFEDKRLIAALENALASRAPAPEDAALRARLETLTPRERQVMEGLSLGHTNKAMARNLAISPRTVEVYRANVMAKMDAPSISDLVRMALKLGLLH